MTKTDPVKAELHWEICHFCVLLILKQSQSSHQSLRLTEVFSCSCWISRGSLCSYLLQVRCQPAVQLLHGGFLCGRTEAPAAVWSISSNRSCAVMDRTSRCMMDPVTHSCLGRSAGSEELPRWHLATQVSLVSTSGCHIETRLSSFTHTAPLKCSPLLGSGSGCRWFCPSVLLHFSVLSCVNSPLWMWSPQVSQRVFLLQVCQDLMELRFNLHQPLNRDI